MLETMLATVAPKTPAVVPISDQKIAFLMVTALCSGMSIITCGFVIITQGPSLKLTFDRERQRFLALVSFLAAIFGLFGNGLQLSDHPKSPGQSASSFFFNWLVQLGFAGIAHNSIIRLLTARSSTPAPHLITRTSRGCCIFYLLTVPVLTPTFIALVNPARASIKFIARDMNITFVCVIEALATAADLALLWKFSSLKEKGHETRRKMARDMWLVYMFIWLTIGADIFAKFWRNKTGDLVSDLAITNLTLTLRAVAALMYGSTLKNAQEIYSQHSGVYGYSLSKSNAGLPLNAPRPPGAQSNTFIADSQRGNQYPLNNITFTTETQLHRDDELYGVKKGFDGAA